MIHTQNLRESDNSPTHENCLKHDNLANQGLGTPDSLLPLSEPLDITNWFSSYKYESLVLETNDNFGFSDHEDTSTGNIEETVENSKEFITSGEKNGMMKKRTSSSTLIKSNESGKDNKCEDNKCESQVEKSDYPDVFLLSSEDPFIKNANWLLSNAYESPEVGHLLGHHHKQSMLDKEKEEGCNGKVENDKNLCLSDDLICNKTFKEESEGSDKENVQESSTENNSRIDLKTQKEMIHARNLGESENSPTYENCLKHNDLANQELGTPDSLLPLSEPLDITNWFSSYKYETLVLETNDNFGFSDHEDSSTGNIEEMVENSEFITSGEKNGMMKKRTSSSTLIKCNESGKDNKCETQIEKSDYPNASLLSSEDPFIKNANWLSNNAYESPEVDHLLSHHRKQSNKEKENGCNGKLQVENDKNLCVSDDLICNKTFEKESDGSDKENVQELSTENVNSFENGAKVPSCTNKQFREGCDSGFVSIMKNKRENDENSVTMCGKNKFLKNENRAVRRKTLEDRTNIQQQHTYSGEMIAGKWKCPRKSKPEIRPPLKQLQLGQWFHHV